MEEDKKITVLSLSNIKGGVGKTGITILLSRFFAAAGVRVLLGDSDLNNSLSFHYLDEDVLQKAEKLNFARALSDEKNDLREFALPTKYPGISLIASSAYLSDLRAINTNRLKKMTPVLSDTYDIFIIDCHPTYDNIVLNALCAADYVITPVLKDLFSFNAAVFMSEVLPRDVPDLRNWFVLVNGWDSRFEESKSGRQSDFLKLFEERELPLTPKETWLPWTAAIHQLIDYGKRLSAAPVTGAVCNPALYNAVKELAGCFFDDLPSPEAF
jgi:chromosome partitioning protein